MSEPFVCGADCDEKGVIHMDMPMAQHRAIVRARFAGKRVDVEVRERKSRRTDLQNRAYHAAITPWAHELGMGVDELKRDLLGLMWGYGEPKVSRLTGEEYRLPIKPHTSRLTTAEFAALMDFTIMTAAKTGYVMLAPDEFRTQQQKASVKGLQ